MGFSRSDPIYRRYLLGWLGMMVLAVVNGGLRDLLYGPRLGELAAHQLSTLLLLVVFTIYFRALTSLWPIASSSQAWKIGLTWLIMTLAFEVVMGRCISGNPWQRVLHDYNLAAGRVWVLIPLWVLVGPYLINRYARRRRG